jgi:hypothetical protein
MDTGSDDEGPPELVESGSHVPPTPGPHDTGKKVPITIVTGVQSFPLNLITAADTL